MPDTPDSKQIQFDRYYQEIYKERWQTLKTALLAQTTPVAFQYSPSCQPYYLDEASVIAASALPVREGNTVLDMCAAPGGKSLVLAKKLGNSGSLVCNDRSSKRRSRLHSVVNSHLDPQMVQRVTITSHDASKWSLYEQNIYDAVLLDAPCSSERHLLHDTKAMAQWSPRRTRMLAIQQFAMLASALEAVKAGGYILYSTCSISPLENEKVVEKLEKKRKGRYEIIDLNLDTAQKCSSGQIILPDSEENLGPLYFCLIRRTG
ncbi:MAG: RsmB/NOP family class I SAM-dependent RNA methyltransferase [Sphaerochaetaceae bacterium]|nr:RsmB/NOP family class I SAM-dependent RNA methyltransferase [Sphaerochaetaceae bacterium]